QRTGIEGAIADVVPLSDTMADRPRDGETISWVDSRKRRLMVVEMYHREADGWRRCVFYSGALLEAGPSPYLDDRGRPCNPIEAQSCYTDRENNRYGMVRDMRGPQDEINKRRSKLLHLMSTRQVQESEYGSLADIDPEAIRREAARPDGVLPSGAQIVPTTDLASGQASLLAEAKSEIERMGPNPAMLGRQAAGSSGRAQMIRQQAGLTELAILFGGIEDWQLRIYRQMWSRARQYWTGPKWVRVTDDQNTAQFIGLNQPQGPVITDPATGAPMLGEDGQPVRGEPVVDAEGRSQFGIANEIAKLDIDIILDSVPDTANLQQEQFALLVELARSGVDLSSPMGLILFEASSLMNKREVLDKLQGQKDDPAAQQARMTQQAIAERGMAAKITETEASAALKGAQAADKQLDTALKGAASGVGPLAPQAGPEGYAG
ncbi:MAG: hypothetical protein WAZ50_00325, partial [Minisyncoccia bacterium]